jgi:hypothetical protein
MRSRKYGREPSSTSSIAGRRRPASAMTTMRHGTARRRVAQAFLSLPGRESGLFVSVAKGERDQGRIE